jgi:hypothetical protein
MCYAVTCCLAPEMPFTGLRKSIQRRISLHLADGKRQTLPRNFKEYLELVRYRGRYVEWNK